MTGRRNRAVAPVVGAVGLLAVTTIVAAVVGGAAVGTADRAVGGDVSSAAIGLSADGDRLLLSHRGGDVLDVRDLTLRISIDGEPLDHQPSVPFFAQRGFRGGPSGPFNTASDHRWRPGEAAGVQIAGSNAPTPSSGSVTRVRISVDGRQVADVTARN